MTGLANISRVAPKIIRVNNAKAVGLVRRFVSLSRCQTPCLTQIHHQNTAFLHNERNANFFSQTAEKIRWEEENLPETINRYFEKLDKDLRIENRVMKHEIENLLRLVEKSEKCSFKQALLIIKACGEALVDLDNASRLDILTRALAVIDECGVKLDIMHFNTLLKVNLNFANFMKYFQCRAG